MSPYDNLLLDIPATLERLIHPTTGGHRVSWSRLKSWQQCKRMWFTENFAVFKNVISEGTVGDGTQAIAGSLEQRFMESYYNSSLYMHPAITDPAKRYAWVYQQIKLLGELIYIPRDQVTDVFANRWFWQTNEGSRRLAEVNKDGLLHPAFHTRIPHVQFIDEANFKAIHGGKHELYNLCTNNIILTIDKQAELTWHPHLTRSELFVEQRLHPKYQTVSTNGKPVETAGMIDFIFNVHQQPRDATFVDNQQLADGFLTLDGKHRVGQHTDPGQLLLYADTLGYMTKRKPGVVAFFDWSKQTLHPHPFDPVAVDKIYKDMQTSVAHTTAIHKWLQTKDPAEEIPINYLPDVPARGEKRRCGFCPLSLTCPDSSYDPRLPNDIVIAKQRRAEVLARFSNTTENFNETTL